MKSMTRILSLALAVILALSLCAVGAFADDAPPSAEPEDETTRSATPAPEAGTPTPAETAAPTATPATAPTAEPSPVPTTAPAETDAAKIWAGYSTTKKDAIKLAILCGAEGNASNLSGSYGSQYTATQMIVWEFVVGVRSTSSPYSVSDNKVINSVCYNGANRRLISYAAKNNVCRAA